MRTQRIAFEVDRIDERVSSVVISGRIDGRRGRTLERMLAVRRAEAARITRARRSPGRLDERAADGRT